MRPVTRAITPPSRLANENAIHTNRMTNRTRITVSSVVSPPTASTWYIS